MAHHHKLAMVRMAPCLPEELGAQHFFQEYLASTADLDDLIVVVEECEVAMSVDARKGFTLQRRHFQKTCFFSIIKPVLPSSVWGPVGQLPNPKTAAVVTCCCPGTSWRTDLQHAESTVSIFMGCACSNMFQPRPMLTSSANLECSPTNAHMGKSSM